MRLWSIRQLSGCQTELPAPGGRPLAEKQDVIGAGAYLPSGSGVGAGRAASECRAASLLTRRRPRSGAAPAAPRPAPVVFVDQQRDGRPPTHRPLTDRRWWRAVESPVEESRRTEPCGRQVFSLSSAVHRLPSPLRRPRSVFVPPMHVVDFELRSFAVKHCLRPGQDIFKTCFGDFSSIVAVVFRLRLIFDDLPRAVFLY